MKRTLFIIGLFACLVVLAATGFSVAENDSAASPSPSVSPSQSPSGTPKVSLPPLSPASFKLTEGEKHLYEISWKNIGAGTGEIEVVKKVSGKGKEYYLIHMTAKSSKIVSVFYKVKDLFVSHLDAEEGFTHRFERHISEGKSFREETVIYDYAGKQVHYSTQRNRKKEPKKTELPLASKVLDPVSSVFRLRKCEMKVGNMVEIPVHSGGDDWVLRLKVVGLVGLRVPGIGKFNAYKLKPEAEKDSLYISDGAMTIWLEKSTKVILRAEVDIPIGVVVIRLIRAEHSPLETVNREEKRRRWIRPGTKDIP